MRGTRPTMPLCTFHERPVRAEAVVDLIDGATHRLHLCAGHLAALCEELEEWLAAVSEGSGRR
jgi:hypothetical protein